MILKEEIFYVQLSYTENNRIPDIDNIAYDERDYNEYFEKTYKINLKNTDVYKRQDLWFLVKIV